MSNVKEEYSLYVQHEKPNKTTPESRRAKGVEAGLTNWNFCSCSMEKRCNGHCFFFIYIQIYIYILIYICIYIYPSVLSRASTLSLHCSVEACSVRAKVESLAQEVCHTGSVPSSFSLFCVARFHRDSSGQAPPSAVILWNIYHLKLVY